MTPSSVQDMGPHFQVISHTSPTLPGGSDALIAIWKDTTVSDADAEAEAEEQLAEQEQELQNALMVRGMRV